jgi:transposase
MKRIELDIAALNVLVERATARPLNEEEHKTLKAAIETLAYLTQLVEQKSMSIKRLRQMLFGASTEKTRNAFKNEPKAPDPQESADAPEPSPGHGRNGAQDYPGADKIQIKHPELTSGDLCPECEQGKVYDMAPGVMVRVTGCAPLQATVLERGKLRCNLCGQVFTAPAPEGLGTAKYDARAKAMIALLKYGSGMPFYRLQRLQHNLGIPLPTSTQWEIVEETATVLKPVFAALIWFAAQGNVLHNDDTTAKILALMAENAALAELPGKQRTGIFTSGIVSIYEQHQIALFFTGRQHAGENLTDVLAHRAAELAPPIQMCDAANRNEPDGVIDTIIGNCVAHARRKYFEVAPSFPDECKFVLDILKDVYKIDGRCKQQHLSDEQRLLVHQAESGPLMEKLDEWLEDQFAQRKVEPNSGLGQAITYMRNHWQKLTLFLRQAGAPLDNNIVERSLKMAILHRKNAMFYKTQNGADVGDLFMSLIYTCQLCGTNPFEYLTALQQHRAELVSSAPQWMPWNYTGSLQQLGAT